ncbi:hypothetical protein [Hafnia alvei]|uniref:hypothetical protein n=1 Tax=Hafnia alvei TaxID=569 RepID=UPI00103439BA|nr:hypothetical protein [Hafnia alvei]TBL95380.1 hypothetical protein EYY90_08005 [Hafnia alvei]
MQHVMLFGEGWNGEVRDVEAGMQEFRYIPNQQDPHLREVLFTIKKYISDDGEMYLVGYFGKEPLMPDVEEAIFKYKPTPI